MMCILGTVGSVTGWPVPTCRQMVSREVFSSHFWEVYDRLQQTADDEVGMPGYFRFITLLGELRAGH